MPWPLAARALVLAVVVAAGVRTWRRAPGLLPALVVGYALLYACNGLAVGAGPDPRYMYLLMPILVVAAAALLPDPASVVGRLAGVLAVVGVATGLSLWLLWGTRDVATPHDAPKYVNSQGVQRVAEVLDELDVGTAITDSSGMQINFFTDGRVRAASFDVPRMRADERAARADPTTTYVLDGGEYGNADHLEFWLQLNGVDYERRDIGRWRVFLLDEQVLPQQAGLRTFAGHD